MAADREKILQAAQKYVDKKRYDRAIEEYQKIVQQDPSDARTLLKIGDLQARMEAYADAIATYDRVGQYYAAQGFALKAIAVYKQIRELIQKFAPQLGDRYGHIVPKLAEIYTQLGLTSDALAAYDEVATRLQRAGRDRDAIDVFRRMVALDASNPLPHLRLAEACCRVQSLDEAIDSFSLAAELLMKLNRRDDALKVIERILHFRQDVKFARLAAELYLQGGTQQDGLQALAKLQICFQANPKDLGTLSLLGQAFNAIGQAEKAVEVYKEMARLARETGETALLREVLDHLVAVAPHDEQVRALASLGPPQRAAAEDAMISVEAEFVDELPASEAYVVEVGEDEFEGFESEVTTAPRRPMTSAPDVVIVDESIEAVEELGDIADSFDARAHARKAVVDAESFRKLRLYSKATETLQIALEIDPRSVPIREKLRDVLGEAGDEDGSIGEMITIAAIHVDQGQLDPAAQELYRVLEREPEHPTALQMLEDMGIVVGSTYAQPGDAGRDAFETAFDDDDDAAPAPMADFDPGEPLPSYDLEEVGAAAAMGSGEHAAVSAPVFDAVDDPFGEPLPSFPLAAEAPPSNPRIDTFDDVTDATAPQGMELGEPLPAFGDLEEDSLVGLAAPEASGGTGADASAVEEVLEEAEFFLSRGLEDDARMIIEDQLTRTPGHPLLIERLRELDELRGTPGESGAHEVGAASLAPAEPDRSFDIAASLDALDEFDDLTGPSAPSGRPAFASEAEEVDVDQVFAKFKEGVSATVAEGDSATHYDLGVAYKEMGLLSDAINEFTVAAQDSTRECMCFAMVGMIHLEQGRFAEAADAYVKGLHAAQKTVEQEMSLYYDLGNVYELQTNTEEALYYFQKIARRDPGYRDVKDRIASLNPPEPPRPAARVINDDDEFDKVFDELFDTK